MIASNPSDAVPVPENKTMLGNDHPQGIGVGVLRREDRRFLLGRGRYVSDLQPRDVLHAAFVRSPHAHAHIVGIDANSARQLPGVRAVLTGQDMADDGIGVMRGLYRLAGADGAPMAEPPRYALARGTVRHVGEPLALVLADTPQQAADAAEAVQVEWQPLPSVVDARDAARPDAPRVHADLPNNLCVQTQRGDAAATDAAFARAAHIARVSLRNQRLCCAAIEPRAVLAQPADEGGSGLAADGATLTLWTSTQTPHHVRLLVSEQLGMAENALRVISPDVGGGFGTKGKHYPEEAVLAWAAGRLQRTLKWVSSRSEAFVSDYQARDHWTEAELALDAAGHFIGLRVRTQAALGAWASTVGPAIPASIYAAILSGPYRIPAIDIAVQVLFTHTVPTDAYRGAGRPEACFVLEQLCEQAARVSGIDRFALRRINFIPSSAMPYRTPIGPVYDCGDFARLFEKALQVSDFKGFFERRARSAKDGMLRGFGACYFVESSGVAPSRMAGMLGARAGMFESAQIRIAADASLQLACGTHSHGQGHATSFAQVVASRLGLPLARIEVIEGDTARVPYGTGTFGSRSMVLAGSASMQACDRLTEKARRVAAHLLEADERDVGFAVQAGEGRFAIQGTDRSVGWPAVARALNTGHQLPPGMEPGLQETAFYDPSNFAWSNGAQACEVEIDPATGVLRILRYVCIDDIGTVVNPVIVEGQVHGATAQGIGQALMESTEWDGSGQLLSGSFMDYALPRASDLPWFETECDESQPCTHNPLGAKGCGEAGTIGAPAALMSAVQDALSCIGATAPDMPLSAHKLWRAIQQAPGNKAPDAPNNGAINPAR
jgi:carbon-monoxide dehydrogenase large subunit